MSSAEEWSRLYEKSPPLALNHTRVTFELIIQGSIISRDSEQFLVSAIQQYILKPTRTSSDAMLFSSHVCTLIQVDVSSLILDWGTLSGVADILDWPAYSV